MVKTSKMQAISAFLSLLSLLTWGLVQPQISGAAEKQKNAYEMGRDFYQKGEYANAIHYFEHVARLKPQFWPVHYSLGNAYMKIGELQLAKASYMSCLIAKPDIPTCKNCSKAVEYLNIAIARKEDARNAAQLAKTTQSVPDPAPNTVPENAKIADARENEAYENTVKELTEKRDAILAEGHKQANAIRERYEERIRWIHENTNQHVINRATGEFGVGMDVDTHLEICTERDEEVKKVMDIAEARAKGIHIPPPPTIGTSLSSSNLHANSNAFVRHYKHKSPHHSQNQNKQNRQVAENSPTTTSK